MQIDSLESWLSQHTKSGALNSKDSILLDVGAYHGDFSKQMFLENNIQKAILFEPNKDNYNILQSNFADNTQVELIHSAVGDQNGDMPFYCDSDRATGSVLAYHYSPEDIHKIKSQQVNLITLDHFVKQKALSDRISMIKIDTQGYDLNVLKGAKQTIKEHRPWIVAELIYVSLYENQSDPHEIALWLTAQDYALAGMFNMHYTADGWLAFADGVFVSKDKIQTIISPFYMNKSNAQLAAENTMLQHACAERLELIIRLDKEIKHLQSGSKKYASTLKKLIKWR